MAESLAVQAYQQQNLVADRPEDTRFPGHDTFQNGIVENGQPTTFYTAATNRDIENINNRSSNMSGFLTDESTVNACKTQNGVLDANAYADKTQTQPWRPYDAPRGTDYTYRENIAAFDVKWDKLNSPDNTDLRARLCDSDGNLKCAYGKAEANTHWGDGGGNQYYINKSDFNEGVNRGVFQYNDEKTLKESSGTLNRSGVSEGEYRAMSDERRNVVNRQLASCQDKTAVTDIDKARSLNEITPDKARQINSAQASEGNYLARPDPAYSQSQSSSSNQPYRPNELAENNIAAGGGARAPNSSQLSDSRDIDFRAEFGLGSAPSNDTGLTSGISAYNGIK